MMMKKYNLKILVYGNFRVSHLSFGPQKAVDKYEDIYQQYRKLAKLN